MRTPTISSGRLFSLLLLLGWLGCNDTTSPPPVPEPDPLANLRYSIWIADSYAGDGVVRLYWDAAPFCDWPPCIPLTDIRQVRVQMSNAGPAGVYRTVATSSIVGLDSAVVPDVPNGTLCCFRIASCDSSGQIIGISRVLETLPGPLSAPTARVPAYQRHYNSPSLAWSPDGNQLAFAKADGCVRENLYAYDFTTAAIRQLTYFTEEEQLTAYADWSADGATIAFMYSPTLTNYSLNYRIWTLDVASEETRPITSGRYDGYPAWAGDQEIVFVRYQESPRSREIHRVSLQSSAVNQITFDGWISKGAPTVSPDGGTIAYAGGDSSGSWIFTIPASGGESRRVLGSRIYGVGRPAWAPNGTTIYFVTDRSGHDEIWSFDLGSQALQQITRVQARGRIHCAPAIDPSGARLACFRSWGSQTEIFVYPLGPAAAERSRS